MVNHQVVDRIVEVLGHTPAGLFSDFDGVLSEIAATPDAATAHPGAAEAIAAIANQVSVAGIITGRAVDDVATKMSIADLIVVGNHGLEWWNHGVRHDHPAGVAAITAIGQVLDQVRTELSAQTDITHLIWENKRLSGTIHFRNVDDPAAVEQLILAIVQPLADAHGLRCTPGKMIVELRPTALVTKGTALTEIAREHGLESIVFIGDDVTDVDGFRSLSELRAQGRHTLAVGVVTPDSHPDVAAHADVMVTSVAEMVEVLAAVAVAMEQD